MALVVELDLQQKTSNLSLNMKSCDEHSQKICGSMDALPQTRNTENVTDNPSAILNSFAASRQKGKTFKFILPKLTASQRSDVRNPLAIRGKRSYRCQECPHEFNAYRLLKAHCLEQHNSNTTASICEFCSSLYADKQSLTEHQSKQCSEGKYACLVCAKQYTSKGRLQNHYKAVHNQYPTYRCTLCSSTASQFNTHAQLAEHYEAIHTVLPAADDDDEEMTEEFLDEFLLPSNDEENSLQFADWETLDLYLPDMLHLPPESSAMAVVYKCPQCDKRCDNQKILLRHLAQRHALSVLNCSICEASFSNADELRSHKMTHNQPATLTGQLQQCGICDSTLRSKAALIYHIKTHSRGTLRPHACPFCGKQFHADTNFKQHLRVVHSQVKRHVCQLCDAQYATLDHLKKHVLSQHQNERKHACGMCAKRFTQMCHLKQHMSIHQRTH